MLFTDVFGLTSSELLRTSSTPYEILNIDTEKLTQLIEIPSRKHFGIAKAEEIKALAKNSFCIILENYF